jgi:hypothetical protein
MKSFCIKGIVLFAFMVLCPFIFGQNPVKPLPDSLSVETEIPLFVNEGEKNRL